MAKGAVLAIVRMETVGDIVESSEHSLFLR